jgi:hypothetical protein
LKDIFEKSVAGEMNQVVEAGKKVEVSKAEKSRQIEQFSHNGRGILQVCSIPLFHDFNQTYALYLYGLYLLDESKYLPLDKLHHLFRFNFYKSIFSKRSR